MKLTRTICILAGALAVMLTVVVLRAESTRLQFELAKLDRKTAAIWQQLREYELELARLRNPARISERVWEMRQTQTAGAPGMTVRSARP